MEENVYAEIAPITISNADDKYKLDTLSENDATPNGKDRTPAPRIVLARLKIEVAIVDVPVPTDSATIVPSELFSSLNDFDVSENNLLLKRFSVPLLLNCRNAGDPCAFARLF
mmetsp:Transcript_8836/g.13192  ORF Transcript_8836/g.13192 Transcript_8836/m.13192 type:complete len:113 (-) Transcript_8836:55-393(-)